MLNPVKEIGAIAKQYNCTFIVDAISSFGGIKFSIDDYHIDFMISTANKCLQGMAGVGFVICRKGELERIKNYPKRSFYLDLYAQYDFLEKYKQTRFTPPVQTIYALRKAIDEFFSEGALNRYKRYMKNWETLTQGMEKLGFKRLLKDEDESHLLTAFLDPKNPNYDFKKMHDLMKKRGYIIYPGKIGKKNTFRLGNLGAIDHKDIHSFLKNLEEVMKTMNLKL